MNMYIKALPFGAVITFAILATINYGSITRVAAGF